jgi:F420-non-reducing hydrogenase large subunit
MSARQITVDPITRLEGHGKIDIFLNDAGEVERAYFQIPELRGFEIFSLGRPAEDMPQITSRICGVCPTAHHMAGTKALDHLYHVEAPPVAKKVREMIYNTFMLEDHALHVYVLGGPDFIVGPDADPAARNILGVIQAVGLDVGKKVISMRRRLRQMVTEVAGKIIHPVFGLPGGISKGVNPDKLKEYQELAKDSVEFAQFTLETLNKLVLQNDTYLKMITSDEYTHRNYYMGLVDEKNRINFYDGMIRVVDPDEGKEFLKFPTKDYLEHVAEHVEPWSYVKFCYLKKVGWNGFNDGKESGVYSVAPLARLNAADGMATELAQAAYEAYFKLLPKPTHHTLANHYARAVEMLYAAERIQELLHDPEITGTELRVIPTETPTVGVGVVEAPRGTLIHHYETDERGLLTKVNLIVATQNNSARMAMSVEKAAKGLIKNGEVTEGLLNKIEMAFRAYDPCHACATHTLPGQMPLIARVYSPNGEVVSELKR